MVSGDDLQVILAEALPELIKVMFLAEGGSENVLGAFEVGSGESDRL